MAVKKHIIGLIKLLFGKAVNVSTTTMPSRARASSRWHSNWVKSSLEVGKTKIRDYSTGVGSAFKWKTFHSFFFFLFRQLLNAIAARVEKFRGFFLKTNTNKFVIGCSQRSPAAITGTNPFSSVVENFISNCWGDFRERKWVGKKNIRWNV